MGKKGGKGKKASVAIPEENEATVDDKNDENVTKNKENVIKNAENVSKSVENVTQAKENATKNEEANKENVQSKTQLETKKGKGKGKGKPKKKEAAKQIGDTQAEKETTASNKLSIQRMKSREQLQKPSSLKEDEDALFSESSSSSSGSDISIKETKKSKGKSKKAAKGKKGKKTSKSEPVEIKEGETEAAKEPEKEKEGKKKKKDKKKKGEEAATEEALVETTDVLAEINKMRAAAEAAALGIEIEPSAVPSEKPSKGEKKKKKKGKTGEKGPKKKLSKKEKAQLAAQMAEQARIQEELDAVRAIEEERLRLIEEEKAGREKQAREIIEQQLRMEQLSSTGEIIMQLIDFNHQLALKAKADMEWEQYMKCDGMPDVANCGQMNTYLHLWNMKIEATDIEEASKRTTEVIQLLDVLDDLINEALAVDVHQIEDWKWIRLMFREHQQKSLDVATYLLLRDIDKNLNRIDIPTANYTRTEEHFKLALWLRVQLPTPLFNPRKPPRPRIETDFPDMKMNVLFPLSITCDKMAIRAMYLTYDHLSDLSRSFAKPSCVKDIPQDIQKVTLEEWIAKLQYKYDNSGLKKVEEAENPEEQQQQHVAEKDETFGVPIVPYKKLEPSSSTYVIDLEEKAFLEMRQNLLTIVEEGEVNLRKYKILGGIYFLDLFYQPSQPQDLVSYEMTVTRLQMPKELSEVTFHIKYTPPKPPEAGVKRSPEEIEEELKRQEAELDQLMLVTVTLPENIMWMDVPVVCHWNKEKSMWSTLDVHDLKHIEEKGYITFRTGRFGCFAIASSRYTNMPFQAWEIKPEVDGSVTLQITASLLVVDFNIKEGLVCLSQIQNNPNDVLQDIVGVYYTLPKLKMIMRNAGADVFPSVDAFCYIEGTCEKHWPMERHLYYNIAQLSVSYNFAWSRWNMTAGRRNVVLQMREYRPEKVKQPQHSMLLVTPLKASFVDCTEVSTTFTDNGIEGMKFYADLYHLMKGTSGISTRTKVQNANLNLVNTVADLLLATRIVSFS